MAKIPRYHGFKNEDGTIENPYLPTPRTFMKTDAKVVSYQENVDNDEMTIIHIMSKDGNNLSKHGVWAPQMWLRQFSHAPWHVLCALFVGLRKP